MILIVEKDPRFTAKLKKHLKIKGLRNFFVETCQDASFLLKSINAKIILVNLNGVGNWADLKQLVHYANFNDVPILYIQGFKGTRKWVEKLKMHGENNFASLPFTVSDLTRLIESMRKDKDPFLGLVMGQPGQEIEIRRKVGVGAMGTVYEGCQVDLDRRVAIKFLSSDAHTNDSEADARFTQEAKAMANMRSPHVVQVYGVGRYRERPYMIMEYIDGPNLEKYLMTKKTIKIHEALAIIKQVLSGLSEAHRNGKVHRDMKPANIMLNKNGEAIILDFGLVLSVGQNLTKVGTVLGTPRYISPEQVNGAKVDFRSDIYSLGIILFELLVGEPPFQADEFVGVLMKHVNDPLPKPERFGKPLPPRLFEIIQKMTAKKPGDRYASTDDVTNDIDDFLNTMSPDPEVTESTQSLARVLQPVGGLAVNESGSITRRFGDLEDGRGQALFILNNALKQIQDVAEVGSFQRGVISLNDSKMLIFSSQGGLAGIESSLPDASNKFDHLSVDDISKLFQ